MILEKFAKSKSSKCHYSLQVFMIPFHNQLSKILKEESNPRNPTLPNPSLVPSTVKLCTHLFGTALLPFPGDKDKQSPEDWYLLVCTLHHYSSLTDKQCEFHSSFQRSLPCNCNCNHECCPHAGRRLHCSCMAFFDMVACHLHLCLTSI